MADVTQTVANVHAHSGATISLVQGGEAIEPGDWCYLDSGTSKYKLAVGTGAAEATVKGMALGYCPANGDYFPICTAGNVDPGATLTVGGGPLLLSAANAGKMAPPADLSVGEFGSVLGIQVAADKFLIDIQNATVASA